MYIKNQKISNVKASVSPDTDRSRFLDDMSIPILKQEVLQAQSAVIDTVSGATMTSEAYIGYRGLEDSEIQSPTHESQFMTRISGPFIHPPADSLPP